MTWSRNPGNTAEEGPVGPHFSQQFPNCLMLCTSKTYPISFPKFVVGIHAEDMLDVVAMQVSVRVDDVKIELMTADC